MEEKPYACVEVSDFSVKLLVGYPKDGKPVILYKSQFPIEGVLRDCRIEDHDAFVAVLEKLKKYRDPEERLGINISEACLVLPPIGFFVYGVVKTTNVNSWESTIEKIDLDNIASQINKEIIPNGNVIIDAIPNKFTLDDGREFPTPPLGEKSRILTEAAIIPTLPSHYSTEYFEDLSKAGIRKRKAGVACDLAASYLSGIKVTDKPGYVAIDFGANATYINYVYGGRVWKSQHHGKGSADIDRLIASSFGIDKEEAERVKIRYGYNLAHRSYNAPICHGSDIDGNPANYYQSDLNALLENYAADFFRKLFGGIDSVLKSDMPRVETFPVVLYGGGSKLRGLTKLLAQFAGTHELIIPRLDVIGCRDIAYISLLGMITSKSQYQASLAEMGHGISPVSREPNQPKQKAARHKADRNSDVL